MRELLRSGDCSKKINVVRDMFGKVKINLVLAVGFGLFFFFFCFYDSHGIHIWKMIARLLRWYMDNKHCQASFECLIWCCGGGFRYAARHNCYGACGCEPRCHLFAGGATRKWGLLSTGQYIWNSLMHQNRAPKMPLDLLHCVYHRLFSFFLLFYFFK